MKTKQTTPKKTEKKGKKFKKTPKIIDYFKPKTETETTTPWNELKMNPTKNEKKLLKKALKAKPAKTKLARIIQQENKYKHHKEYETTIWGQTHNGQTIKILKIHDQNKTTKNLIKTYQELGLDEDRTISMTDYYTKIKPALQSKEEWTGGTGTYRIKRMTTTTRIIKG